MPNSSWVEGVTDYARLEHLPRLLSLSDPNNGIIHDTIIRTPCGVSGGALAAAVTRQGVKEGKPRARGCPARPQPIGVGLGKWSPNTCSSTLVTSM